MVPHCSHLPPRICWSQKRLSDNILYCVNCVMSVDCKVTGRCLDKCQYKINMKADQAVW